MWPVKGTAINFFTYRLLLVLLKLDVPFSFCFETGSYYEFLAASHCVDQVGLRNHSGSPASASMF